MAWYKIVMQHFLEVYHAISHLSLAFSRYTHEPLGLYSMVYHSKALHDYINILLKVVSSFGVSRHTISRWLPEVKAVTYALKCHIL